MARRQVNIFINGREVANQIKSITSEKRKVVNELKKMEIGSEAYKNKLKELAQLNGILNKHRDSVRGVESTWTKLKGSIGKYAAVAGIALGAREIINYGTELFKLGTEMEVLTKKAETVFGNALPQVDAAAQKNAASIGLTVSQYTDAAAAIGDLLIPMGFQRQEAASISTELVDLSGALSEWTGGQIKAEEVTKILGKAVLGEREQLKSLGISIQEADVKARLAEKGLSKLTGASLQQAKAAATLELITEKSTDAQSAFAKNTDTLVRKQAELKARFQDVQENMAQALVPVFHRLFEIAGPVVATTSEMVIAMLKGEEATGKLSGGMKIAATVLGNAGKGIGFVWDMLRGTTRFILNQFGGAIEFMGGGMVTANNAIVGVVNKIAEITGSERRLTPINTEDFKKSLVDAKAALNDTDLNAKTSTSTSGQPSGAALLQQKAAAAEQQKEQEKAAKERIKIADRTAKELEKREEKLQATITELQTNAHLQQLSEEDKKIAELSAKYDQQIQEAKALEAQGIQEATAQRLELERLKSEAVTTLQNELLEADLAKIAEQEDAKTVAELEALRTREEAKREATRQIQSEINEILLSEQEQALLALEEQLQATLALAEQHGIDTLDIEIAYKKKKKAINDKFDREELTGKEKHYQALQKAFGESSKLIKAAQKGLADAGIESVALSKGLTLAQIGVDTASAISSLTRNSEANPANAVTFGAAGAVQFATGLIRILANIGQAKKVLSQKKEGGWHDVQGKDDGINYRAKYIGKPSSGLLPSHPVVLASEEGPEYFVSNPDLQNPYVLNHVRAIENIVHHRSVTQFKEGGVKGELNDLSPTLPNTETNTLLINVLLTLSGKLDNIYARIDDDTTVSIQNRFAEINAASGGTLG